jgi:hypothetical protein
VIDWVLAFAAVLFAGGLATLTIAVWRCIFRRAELHLAEEAPVEPDDRDTCSVPTFGTEQCGLLAGHAGRHMSWPSGLPYPPDEEPCAEPIDRAVLVVDPPVVRIPAERLNAVGGWVQVGDKTVHRSCNEARRDGRHDLVCRVCADRLGMAPAGGAT